MHRCSSLFVGLCIQRGELERNKCCPPIGHNRSLWRQLPKATTMKVRAHSSACLGHPVYRTLHGLPAKRDNGCKQRLSGAPSRSVTRHSHRCWVVVVSGLSSVGQQVRPQVQIPAALLCCLSAQVVGSDKLQACMYHLGHATCCIQEESGWCRTACTIKQAGFQQQLLLHFAGLQGGCPGPTPSYTMQYLQVLDSK